MVRAVESNFATGFVRLTAQDLGVDRPREGFHAIEASGGGAGGQPFQIAVRARDEAVSAGCNVDDNVPRRGHARTALREHGEAAVLA